MRIITFITHLIDNLLENNMNEKDLDDLGELYHEYSIFGVKNKQLPGIYKPNQYSKAYIIRAYIQLSIAKCKTSVETPVSFTELFCADGYYAMVASHFGATMVQGIDNNRDGHFTKANIIARRLGLTNVHFIQEDVNKIDSMEKVDIVANVGGLYHVSNPQEILVKSYNMAKKYLIVQSVVSMANKDPDYFETPAPGWTWGCRFNKISFDRMIKKLKFDVVDQHFNELEGNERPEDRGSVYYLIKVTEH